MPCNSFLHLIPLCLKLKGVFLSSQIIFACARKESCERVDDCEADDG